jgi:hypothetical protein
MYVKEFSKNYLSELKLISIATDVTDGFRQYQRSTNKYGLDVEVNINRRKFIIGHTWVISS